MGQDAWKLEKTDYILRYYANKIGLAVMEMYFGLRDGHMNCASLLDAAAAVQPRLHWKGIEVKDITAQIYDHQSGECNLTSPSARTELRTTKAMFFNNPITTFWKASC